MERQIIRIAILHSNQLFRESLGFCLEQGESIVVTYTAARLEETREVFRSHSPDLLMLEFGLIRREGLGIADRLCTLSSKIKTLVIEVPDTDNDILYCIERVGASGYLLKNASVGDLVNNIEAIVRGETLCSPRIANLTFCRISQLAHQNGSVQAANRIGLTRRELEVVVLIESGLNNKEIAVRLQIEVSTVKNHVHNILDKLQLHDRHSAAKYVKEQGVIATPF